MKFDLDHEVGPIYVWKEDDQGNYYECDGKEGRPEKFLYMDQFLYDWIKARVLHAIRKNRDYWICIDGRERIGKSTTGRQIARVITAIINKATRRKRKFTADNIAWNSTTFIEKYEEMPKYTSIVLDEGMAAASKGKSSSNTVKDLNEYASVAGFRSKFPVIILPSVFELTGYLGQHRIETLLHLYELGSGGNTRVYMKYYGSNKHRVLMSYFENHKRRFGKNFEMYHKNVRVHKLQRQLDTSRQEVCDMREYDERKDAFVREIVERIKNRENGLSPTEVRRRFIIERAKEVYPWGKYTQKELGDIFGVADSTITRYLAIEDDA